MNGATSVPATTSEMKLRTAIGTGSRISDRKTSTTNMMMNISTNVAKTFHA
jgi:hypothetical protein